MNIIEVGKPFPKEIPSQCSYSLGDGAMSFFIKDKDWKNKEIKAFEKNPFKCGIIEIDNVYGLLFDFESTPQNIEVEFYINAYQHKSELESFPVEYEDGNGLPFWFYVIDENNITRVQRYLVLNTNVSNRLLEILRMQTKNENRLFNEDSYMMRVNNILRTYTTRQLKNYQIMRQNFDRGTRK